jgi:hypothetical protein
MTLRVRLAMSSDQTIQIYGWFAPFRLFHMCLVCLMAVHVVRKPNPSVNPQVIDIIDKSVSLTILFLFSRTSLTRSRDDIIVNVRAPGT